MNTTNHLNINDISFIPGFLDRLKDTHIHYAALSTSDRNDLRDWNNSLTNILTGSRDSLEITPSLVSLCELYDVTGEFVFNEDNIYLNDKPLFEIKTVLDDSGCNVYIYCYDGVGNIISKRNTILSFKVTTWLVDYMVRRLGGEVVLHSRFFQDYWLNKS